MNPKIEEALKMFGATIPERDGYAYEIASTLALKLSEKGIKLDREDRVFLQKMILHHRASQLRQGALIAVAIIDDEFCQLLRASKSELPPRGIVPTDLT